jgi:urate oxidase
MAIVLGANRYGKAENRVVRVDRDGDTHHLVDLNVSTALSGDMADTHLTGANDKVLATDTQKNTVLAFARDGVGQIEDFALRLARHFVDSQDAVHEARIEVEQYPWTRHGPHSFSRAGTGTRLAVVRYDGQEAQVSGGIKDLTVINTTNSEFWGFPRDAFTTLAETKDRILATAVTAKWRFSGDADWAKAYETARDSLLAAFAETYSYSLQQTLYAMGERVLRNVPEVREIHLSLPNRHHYLCDLTPFGRDNPGEVFQVGDRPYGLIQGTVVRED